MFAVREASVEDVEILARHRAAMFRDMGSLQADAAAPLAAATAQWLRPHLLDGSYRAWIVETPAGDLVASGGVHIREVLPRPTPAGTNEDAGHQPIILGVYTERAYRRTGAARLLVQTIVLWCLDQGYTSIVLHPSKEGQPLYEDLGFVFTQEMRLRL